jgi:hypothetical protein
LQYETLRAAVNVFDKRHGATIGERHREEEGPTFEEVAPIPDHTGLVVMPNEEIDTQR